MIRDTLLFSLLLTTGCRISEITELKVSDINFEDEMITILKKKKNKIQLVIVLRKGFGALLRKYQSVNELRDNECLFPGKAKNIPITRQVASNLFKKYLHLANLPDLRIHSLRHSFATHMRDEGMDLLTLMELLGHQKLQTTLNYTQSYYRRNAHIRIKEHEEFYRKFRSRK